MRTLKQYLHQELAYANDGVDMNDVLQVVKKWLERKHKQIQDSNCTICKAQKAIITEIITENLGLLDIVTKEGKE